LLFQTLDERDANMELRLRALLLRLGRLGNRESEKKCREDGPAGQPTGRSLWVIGEHPVGLRTTPIMPSRSEAGAACLAITAMWSRGQENDEAYGILR
jgi:hypothetical protein